MSSDDRIERLERMLTRALERVAELERTRRPCMRHELVEPPTAPTRRVTVETKAWTSYTVCRDAFNRVGDVVMLLPAEPQMGDEIHVKASGHHRSGVRVWIFGATLEGPFDELESTAHDQGHHRAGADVCVFGRENGVIVPGLHVLERLYGLRVAGGVGLVLVAGPGGWHVQATSQPVDPQTRPWYERAGGQWHICNREP